MIRIQDASSAFAIASLSAIMIAQQAQQVFIYQGDCGCPGSVEIYDFSIGEDMVVPELAEVPQDEITRRLIKGFEDYARENPEHDGSPFGALRERSVLKPEANASEERSFDFI